MASKFGMRLLVAALSVAALVAGLVATPAAATHAGEWVLKPSFQQWTTDNGATWADQVPAGFDGNTQEWSSDSGVTWTATQAQYNTGEAGTDSNDGHDAGQFRYRRPHQLRRTWVCLGAESVFTDIGGLFSAVDIARIQPCLGQHSGRTFTTNVDDGIEPPGDWCVVGASAIICRGEGYTYREARRELRF